MNIAHLLIPKLQVAYLYDDYTFRQGLEKMRHHGYTAIPVISRAGLYRGTVSEGDFLWALMSSDKGQPFLSVQDTQALLVSDILDPTHYPSVDIRATMQQLLQASMNQNFIPVVDDFNSFIGIVTRKDIIRYFALPDQWKTATASADSRAHSYSDDNS